MATGMKDAMAGYYRERREDKKAVEKSLREQHPGYNDETIRIMVAFQFGGWENVDRILSDE
jgi:hypothetical protein